MALGFLFVEIIKIVKEMLIMKAKSYAESANISEVFKHSLRQHKTYRNRDIDLNRSKDNYQIGPERNDPYKFYKDRLSQVYCYNRKDVKTCCEWIVSLPKDTPPEEEKTFFETVYQFLTDRFCNGNTNNVVLAVVHKDEKIIGGEPRAHMHYFFLPIVEDKKHVQGEKICKKEAMPRSSFQTIHPDLQIYLKKEGVKGTVHSGITAKQLRNYAVEEIKDGTRKHLENQHLQNQNQHEEDIWDYSSHHDEEELQSEEESWF